MSRDCPHPARRLRYVGYLHGEHRVVCTVEVCGETLSLRELAQDSARMIDSRSDVHPIRRTS